MQQSTYPYEILIRLRKDGVVGAQYQTITDIIADDGVTVIASQMGPTGPLACAGEDGVELATIMGEAAAAALLENEQLKGQNIQMAMLIQTLQQQLDTAIAQQS